MLCILLSSISHHREVAVHNIYQFDTALAAAGPTPPGARIETGPKINGYVEASVIEDVRPGRTARLNGWAE